MTEDEQEIERLCTEVMAAHNEIESLSVRLACAHNASNSLWNAATQALAQLERHDPGTADAIRAEFSGALKSK